MCLVNNNQLQSTSFICHSREARINEADFPAVVTNGRGPRTNQSVGEIIDMLMSQQSTFSRRILNEHDRHHSWRLNVDNMSYEELLELSDRIGYVGNGLQEEEIFSCLRKFNSVSNSLPMAARQKDWKCSICQEKSKRSDDISTLSCGHYHHTQCIKQWLLFKNACPVCKTAALSKSTARGPAGPN
ncbi:RING/U-box superfamily protein [Striga asiatica]|uniref:RING-type E3 ubiquitin transferase n=1 Tax=Striga asiatica TaxID=4170 RepID=A0A5A7PKG3_STRAF|nr:RING/U-box superfamily protein [Striga asiatica]